MIELLHQNALEHEKKDDLRELNTSNNFNQTHILLGKMSDDFRKYVSDDTKWKEDNQSALDNMRNITGLSKFGLGAIVSLGTALYAANQIYNFFKHKI